MQNNVEEIAAKGRGGDTQVAHVMKGETMIPPGLLSQETMQQIYAEMQAAGVDPTEFVVGNGMSINPETGLPEFGFGKFFKKVVKIAAPVALSYFGTPLLGTALGGGLAGSLGAGAIIGGASGALSGGNILKSAALGGLGGALNSAASGALDNTALGRGISDLYSGSALKDVYTGASGALNNASAGLDSLYQGSSLQNAFKSGGHALKSVGIDTTSLASSPAPAVGGGASSYGPQLENAANIPGYASNAIGPQLPNAANTPSALTSGATQVAGSQSFASPLLSALLGTRANDQAEEALLKGQRANQALLAPYANGFSFTPGDLTQDPGYQFNLQQGTQAADRAQLARSGYFSGEAAKELAQFNQGLADNTYNTAFNRALQGRQAGLTGALANAGVNENIGNIKANSATNTGNLYSGALGSVLGGNSFTNTGALQGGFDIQEFLRRNGIGASAYGG